MWPAWRTCCCGGGEATRRGSAFSLESGFVAGIPYRKRPKIFLGCKVLCLPGFPLKVFSVTSDSSERRVHCMPQAKGYHPPYEVTDDQDFLSNQVRRNAFIVNLKIVT